MSQGPCAFAGEAGVAARATPPVARLAPLRARTMAAAAAPLLRLIRGKDNPITTMSSFVHRSAEARPDRPRSRLLRYRGTRRLAGNVSANFPVGGHALAAFPRSLRVRATAASAHSGRDIAAGH